MTPSAGRSCRRLGSAPSTPGALLTTALAPRSGLRHPLRALQPLTYVCSPPYSTYTYIIKNRGKNLKNQAQGLDGGPASEVWEGLNVIPLTM